jgi:hypothetical protein
MLEIHNYEPSPCPGTAHRRRRLSARPLQDTAINATVGAGAQCSAQGTGQLHALALTWIWVGAVPGPERWTLAR